MRVFHAKPLVTCILAAFSLSLAQEANHRAKAQPDDVVKISTELVQLDAVVTDRAGQRRTRLTRSDFQILEDDVPQEILHFAYIAEHGRSKELSEGAAELENAAPPTAAEVGRVIAFVVDDFNILSIDLVRARDMLNEYADHKMRRSDLVAVVRTARGNGLYDQFTSDKELLKRSISQITTSAAFDPYGDTYLTDAEIDNGNMAAISRIHALLETMKGLPGRKSLVLVSPGYLATENYGAVNRLLTETVDRALRAGVVIYAVDILGLQDYGILPTPLHRWSTVQYLSNNTGGKAFINNNDYRLVLDRIMEDSEGYYVLAYAPKNRNFDGRFRRIEVKVPKGLVVRTRNGYYATTESTGSPSNAEHTELLEILRSPLARREIPVNAAIYKTYGANQPASVTIQLHIDAHNLKLMSKDGHFEDQLEIAGLISDATGKTATWFSQSVILRLIFEEREQALKEGFSATIARQLRPGAYQLRALVRETSTGAVGTASQYFEVPRVEKSRFALSSLFVREEPLPDFPNAPRVKRRFHVNAPLLYQVVVYNPAFDRKTHVPSLTSQVKIHHANQIVFDGPVQPVRIDSARDSYQLVVGGRLDLSGFGPGAYLVEIRISDLLRKKGPKSLGVLREIELFP